MPVAPKMSPRLLVPFILVLIPAVVSAQTYLPHFHPQGRGPTYTDAANGTSAMALNGGTLALVGNSGRAVDTYTEEQILERLRVFMKDLKDLEG